MAKFTDMCASEYRQCKPISVTSGSTWLRTPWGTFFVVAETPVKIRRYFEANPQGTVRAEILPIRA